MRTIVIFCLLAPLIHDRSAGTDTSLHTPLGHELTGLAWGAFAQDEAEAKKKRMGEILKETFKLREQKDQLEAQLEKLKKEGEEILKALGVKDRGRLAFLEEIVEKYAPELKPQIEGAKVASNERNASAALKTLSTAEMDFRSNDRDNNRVNDFWVADVSGLYRINPGDGAIMLIDADTAQADARPCVALDAEGQFGGVTFIKGQKGGPRAGYVFISLTQYQEKGSWVKYDDGKGRCGSRFGFCAYPAEYPKQGRHTFILSEDGEIWKKDTGGKPPEGYPENPLAEAWDRLR